ncbi:MAG: hypothetical protein WBG30_15220 [Psychrilyobacter sp.]|uniref:hypothetical protein n=1 Tax=Psychrilyobacter sp. TaxID=2586924 RepID=UPI003C738793
MKKRPWSTLIDKFKQYRSFIDIDYSIYFTKTYFTFNAYFKNKCPTNNGRDRIKNIKDEIDVKQKFKDLVLTDISFKILIKNG